jgi:hypothetical protein
MYFVFYKRKAIVNLQQIFGRVKIQLCNRIKVVGWEMSPREAQSFFKDLEKTIVTYFGYSSVYENEAEMLEVLKRTLAENSPERAVINFGVTQGGLGVLYPIAKSMGFTTTGIVSTLALEHPDSISRDVDYVCFIKDTQWGGKLPNSDELSPTSLAMVTCSDILIGIGGGEVCRDELLYGRELSKPIQFYPAEMHHEWWTQRMKKMGLPPPDSFWGAAHEVFGKRDVK